MGDKDGFIEGLTGGALDGITVGREDDPKMVVTMARSTVTLKANVMWWIIRVILFPTPNATNVRPAQDYLIHSGLGEYFFTTNYF